MRKKKLKDSELADVVGGTDRGNCDNPPKFKVGDRVRLLNHQYYQSEEGEIVEAASKAEYAKGKYCWWYKVKYKFYFIIVIPISTTGYFTEDELDLAWVAS